MPYIGEIRVHKITQIPFIYEFGGREHLHWCNLRLFVWGLARTVEDVITEEDLGDLLSEGERRALVEEARTQPMFQP